jgi:hypothetical protein
LKKVVSLINHKDSFEEAKNNSADILIEWFKRILINLQCGKASSSIYFLEKVILLNLLTEEKSESQSKV